MREPDEHRRARLAARSAKYRDQVAGLRAIHDTTLAELCTHHMPPANCNDCRMTPTRSPRAEAMADVCAGLPDDPTAKES